LRPGDSGVSLSKCGRKLAGRLPDDLDVVNHPGVDEFVFDKCAPPSLGIALNPVDRLQDILQTPAIIPHMAIASFKISFRTAGRRPRSEATSTGRLSRCSSSRTKAA
jgi:hypothetical protein